MSSALVVHRLAGRLLVVDGGPGPWRRRHGVLPGDVRFGAADDRALAALNIAVGNAWHAPGLELLVGPLVLRAEARVTLASDVELRVGDEVLSPGRVLHLEGGQRVQVTPRVLIATIAVAGGVGAVPGTTFVVTEGVACGASGLDVGPSPPGPRSQGEGRQDEDVPVRIVAGPERDAFNDEAWHLFLTTAWTVSPTSSRLGVRLVGPVLATPSTSMTTAPAWTGAVQVPPSGQPIILGVDSRTTGGYPRLAHVIAVDRWRLGQARPGRELRFAAIDLDEARALRRAREETRR